MEFHVKCEKEDVARYVFCPGDQARAKLIADHFEDVRLVSDNRGIVVYSGYYQGVYMTSCGTGMGGPAVAIALEELAHLGADTFIRVGSCGVFQDYQKPGDIIIATGTFRAGGTSVNYLPLAFPAVPNFKITQKLVEAAETLDIPYTAGVATAGDAFYAPRETKGREMFKNAGVVAAEMESDTLFIVGQFRGWRTGALFVSDGSSTEIKPAWGEELYKKGQLEVVKVAVKAMQLVAEMDKE